MNPAVAALRAQDREPEPRRQLIDCAHANCMSHAICKVKRKQGWANLCDFHYTNHDAHESQAYCEKNGLSTIEKKMAHIRSMLNKPKDYRAWMAKPKSRIAQEFADKFLGRSPVRERVPGEDDEPIVEEEITI
jgi:hypothetical protein